ncbi:MAG: hypothetical protein CSA38_01365 [Flavobacteriales bacterium]|nr:MAG: hypothetical protein CSA38_01365 [Flavobacteriales bacterium]
MYNLRKDVIFSVFVQFSLMVFGLLINKLLSNHLSVEEYGQFNIIKRTATIISFVLLAGMGIAIPKYVPQNKTDIGKFQYIFSGFFLVLMISVVFFVGILVFESKANDIIFNGDEDIMVAYFYGISITFLSFLYAYYRGLNKILSFNLIQMLVQFLILVVAYFCTKNVFVFIKYSIVVNFGVFVVFSLLEGKKYFKIGQKVIKENLIPSLKELWSFGYSRMVGDLFLFSLTAVPLLIVNKKFTEVEVAYFSVAITLTSLVSPIFSYIGVILLPKVSQAMAENKIHEVFKTINKFMAMYIVLSVGIIGFIYLFDDFLIRLFFSAEYLPSKNIIFWVSFGILPNALYLLLRNPIDAYSKIPFNTINLIIACVIGFSMMWYSEHFLQIGKSYLVLQIILGVLSFVVWGVMKKKENV